jgi:hypothetical protein
MGDGLTFWQRRSLKGKAAILAFMVVPIAAWFAGFMTLRVVPSGLAVKIGLALAIAYAIAWVLLTEISIVQSDPQTEEIQNIRARWFVRTRWMRVPLMLSVGFMVGYGAAMWTLPWGITQLFGTPSEQIVTIEDWHIGTGERDCTHPRIGRAVLVASPTALCVQREDRARMDVGSRIRLVGPVSAFGVNVEQMLPVPAS